MNAQAPVPDRSAGDREPSLIPAAIQRHGFLLGLTQGDLSVVHASANLPEHLRLEVDQVIGRRLDELMPDVVEAIASDLRAPVADPAARYLRTVDLPGAAGAGTFDAVAHRAGDLIVLELERVAPGDTTLDALYPAMRGFVEQLHTASTVETLCRLIAEDIRRITGFDRALVCRFDENWDGTVIAEDRNEQLPSCLDLRFPASDIPVEERELYRRTRVRMVGNGNDAPVPVLPVRSPTGQPLDMSYAVLRGASPVHLEQLRSMGAMASMSVAVLREGALWGLISCHSREPRRVAFRVRNTCDFLTQIFSLQLAARETALQAEKRVRLGSVQARLLGYMAEEERFLEGLMKHPAELLELTGAAGAAIASAEHIWLAGITPSEGNVRELFEWLSEHHREDVFATESLGSVFSPAMPYADRASGLLAISISKMQASYVLWFRPEVVQTVRWGGVPQKTIEEGATPPGPHPRQSSEIRKETVRGRCLPWQDSEIEAAKEFRHAVLGIVLRRAEELASLSEELQRSNKELEAFSYSVSHDLRAPFRHIVGYSELLRSQEGDRLTDKGRRFVDTIIESAYTAGTLVDNLLRFSQMGRASLKPRLVDMDVLVQEVKRSLALDIGERNVEWILHPLAPARADPMMLRLAIENLLSNALKYTRSRARAIIEIGCRREPNQIVYYVRDNGVGFDMTYVGKLFGVFQRLHKIEEFEGTGIGLANVRRIVERHGGRTWAEGAVEKGATFYFSLPAAGEV